MSPEFTPHGCRATARGQSSRLPADTRSVLNADYSGGGEAPILRTLRPEIVEAAAKDNAALGVEPLLPPVTLAPAPVETGPPSAATDQVAREIRQGPAPDADGSPSTPARRAAGDGALPMRLVLGAVAAATIAVWAAYYLLRPRSD